MFGRQEFCGLEAGEDSAPVSNERNMRARAFDIRLSKWYKILSLRYFPLFAIQQGVLHEHHRVVVANGGFKETFRVVRSRRGYHLYAWRVGEKIFRCV